MKVAIYARESTDDTKRAPPIEEQINRGKAWVEENNHELVFVFADNGYSGGNWKRPDWNKAVRHARGGHYNILWTWNQDRIARDTEQFLFFFRNLNERSIKIYSETDGWVNMDDVGGTAKHVSLAMASEIFRKVTGEKVKRTYDRMKIAAEKKGQKVEWGRKKKKLDTKRIMELRNEGKGFKKIAKIIGEETGKKVSYQTIKRRIQNTHEEL